MTLGTSVTVMPNSDRLCMSDMLRIIVIKTPHIATSSYVMVIRLKDANAAHHTFGVSQPKHSTCDAHALMVRRTC